MLLAPYNNFFSYVFFAKEYISIIYFLYLRSVSSNISNIF